MGWICGKTLMTLADAILDRLLHNSIRLELQGESLRKKQKSLQSDLS